MPEVPCYQIVGAVGSCDGKMECVGSGGSGNDAGSQKGSRQPAGILGYLEERCAFERPQPGAGGLGVSSRGFVLHKR